MIVSIVPASAALLNRFPNAFVPVSIFAVIVVLIQLTTQWLWQHASRHGLTNPALDARVVASIGRRLNLSAIVFGCSIPLALLSTTLSGVFGGGLDHQINRSGEVLDAQLRSAGNARSFMNVKFPSSKLSLILHGPPEVGAHIQTSKVLAGTEIDLTRFPMTEQEGEYRSANYDTAAHHVDIHMDFAGDSVQIV